MTTTATTRPTVGSVLFGDADPVAAIGDALETRQVLSPAGTGLLNLSAAAHQAVSREVSTALADLLDIDLVELLIGIWRTHDALLAAARDTADAPAASSSTSRPRPSAAGSAPTST